MKKVKLVLVSICMFSLLVSCKEDEAPKQTDSIIGEWERVTLTMTYSVEGKTWVEFLEQDLGYSSEMLSEVPSSVVETDAFSIRFNEDATFRFEDEVEEGTGEYELVNNKTLSFKIDGEEWEEEVVSLTSNSLNLSIKTSIPMELFSFKSNTMEEWPVNIEVVSVFEKKK